jgi:hypothetical protein
MHELGNPDEVGLRTGETPHCANKLGEAERLAEEGHAVAVQNLLLLGVP